MTAKAPEFVCERLAACDRPLCTSTSCKCRPCTCKACIARSAHLEHRAEQTDRVIAARRVRLAPELEQLANRDREEAIAR